MSRGAGIGGGVKVLVNVPAAGDAVLTIPTMTVEVRTETGDLHGNLVSCSVTFLDWQCSSVAQWRAIEDAARRAAEWCEARRKTLKREGLDSEKLA